MTLYKKYRAKLLQDNRFDFLVKLGGGAEAFDCGPGNMTNICMVIISKQSQCCMQPDVLRHRIKGIDISDKNSVVKKTEYLPKVEVLQVEQLKLLESSSQAITIGDSGNNQILADFADCFLGVCTGDMPRFACTFWEHLRIESRWQFYRSTPSSSKHWDGTEKVLLWEDGNGTLESDVPF